SAPDAPFPDAYSALRQPGDCLVATKCDLEEIAGADLAISVVTGEGMGELLANLSRGLAGLVENAGLIGHRRQLTAVEHAQDALMRARDCVKASHLELAAEELRTANRALQRLIGTVDVEDVLGEVFASFCLGK
ncbi:MAG: tRNA uridine-5-carboxymethylaminomethyl(34) synthesis GTPase MnmE, partial [Pseudomonadota bacterium]